MRISFDILTTSKDSYRVILSSGKDAFFATTDFVSLIDIDIDIVEIDLERLSGNKPTELKTLRLITTKIIKFIKQNKKTVLYYYCDDMSEIVGVTKEILWPQEYRNRLFSLLFERFCKNIPDLELKDVTIQINQVGRPLFMHLITRLEYVPILEKIRNFLLDNYGK